MGVAASDLSRSVVVSILTCVLGTGLAVAVNFATEEGAGLLPWIAVVALTLLSAVLAIVLHPKRKPARGQLPPGYGSDYGPGYGYGYGSPPRRPPYGPGPGGQPAGWWPPPARPKRTVSWVAVLLVLLVIGGGAGGVAYGGWYAVTWITGNETGTDVLAREVSASEGPLTLTVHKVEVTAHLTKVELTASNTGRDSLGLPLYGYCQLNAGGATIGASPFRSKWEDSVAPGRPVRGTIVFGGRPAAGATTATLRFTRVFGFDPPSISIDIPLRAG